MDSPVLGVRSATRIHDVPMLFWRFGIGGGRVLFEEPSASGLPELPYQVRNAEEGEANRKKRSRDS